MSPIDLIVGLLIGLELQVLFGHYITKGRPVIPLTWIVEFLMKQEKKQKEKEKKV